jgi:hypothetical protein
MKPQSQIKTWNQNTTIIIIFFWIRVNFILKKIYFMDPDK